VSLGSVTTSDLTVNGAFTSKGIDDNATSTAITIDSSENVGIGTAPTANVLTVGSTSATAIRVINTVDSDQAITLGDPDDITKNTGIYARTTGDFSLVRSGGPLKVGLTNGDEHMTIDGSGNVGIGNAAPQASLDVLAGAEGEVARFTGAIVNRGLRMSVNTTVSASDTVTFNVNGAGTGAYKFDTDSVTRYEIDRLGQHLWSNDVGTELMRINTSGNVGIGESSPSSRLTVREDNTSGETSIACYNPSADGDSAIWFGLASNRKAGIKAHRVSTGNDHDLAFYTNTNSSDAAERMRIDSTGNVGIGTSDPQQALHVAGGGLQIEGNISAPAAGTESALIDYFNNNMRFWSRGTSSTRGTFEFVQVENDGQNQQSPMVIDASGNVGIGTSQPGLYNSNANDLVAGLAGTGGNRGITIASGSASLGTLAFANGATGNDLARQFIRADHNDGAMLFATSAGEKMRLDTSGNLLVGKTTEALTVAGCRIQQAGDIRISKTGTAADTMIGFYRNGSGTSVGRIESTSTATDFITSSDERLKDNIVDASAGNINDLKVRSFDWKVDGSHQEYGFIAQELETVAPYAVSKGEIDDDMWGVDYSKLVPMLVKEIQDLKAKVEALENA
jgi:hypothetical protein